MKTPASHGTGTRARSRRFAVFAAVLASLACGRPSVSESPATPSRALEAAWVVGGDVLPIGDAPLAAVLPDDELLIGDAQFGSVYHVTASGEVRAPAITPGSGPWQAAPPFSLWTDGSDVFAIGTGFSGSQVLAFSWLDRTSRVLTPRERAGEPMLRPVACGALGCLVIEGDALSAGTVPPRAGASWVDTARYGWWRPRSDSASIQWLFEAPTQRLVSFDWPQGPLPAATGGHEFDLGTLVTVSGNSVWSLDATTGVLARWRDGVALPVSARLDALATDLQPRVVEDSTRARLAQARTDLERNRVRASRDLRFLARPAYPVARSLVPAADGGVAVELFADGVPSQRLYVRVDSAGVIVDTVAVAGQAHLLTIGRRLAVGYSPLDDRVYGYSLPSPQP